MFRNRTTTVLAAIAACAVTTVAAMPQAGRTDAIDYAALSRIRAEGLQNSQVMELASWMTDVYGPRLSGSPNLQKAGEWAAATMKDWGLQNVALEPWANHRRQVEPAAPQVAAVPAAPRPSTARRFLFRKAWPPS